MDEDEEDEEEDEEEEEEEDEEMAEVSPLGSHRAPVPSVPPVVIGPELGTHLYLHLTRPARAGGGFRGDRPVRHHQHRGPSYARRPR